MCINSKITALLPVYVMFLSGTVFSQEALLPSGGEAQGNGGSVSYSIGQTHYISVNNSTGTVSQGVQQAYEIFTVGIFDHSIEIDLSVFPNPTANELNLKVSNWGQQQMQFRLLDMSGKVLISRDIIQETTILNMLTYPPAVYLLEVYSGNQPVKSFKIIKNK